MTSKAVAKPKLLYSLQFPPGTVSDGAASGDGLGLDRHLTVPVQLDLRGRHLRPHFHPQMLEGV